MFYVGSSEINALQLMLCHFNQILAHDEKAFGISGDLYYESSFSVADTDQPPVAIVSHDYFRYESFLFVSLVPLIGMHGLPF